MRCIGMGTATRGVALVLLTLVACGDRRPGLATPEPVVAQSDGGVDAPAVAAPEPADPPRIAPHTANVGAAVLDRTGQVAVTLDTIGGIRVWPALDGTRRPAVVPLTGARTLDVAHRGGGLVVGAIDLSGAAHLYRLSLDGGLAAIVDVPAVPQAIALVAVADGWLLARADQSIVWLGDDGAMGAALERDGARIAALVRSERGNGFALLTHRDGDAVAATVVAIAARGRDLSWGHGTTLAQAPQLPAELAISPDEKLLAYVAMPPGTQPISAGPALPDRQPQARAEAPFDDFGGQFTPATPVTVAIQAVGDGAVKTPTSMTSQILGDVDRLTFTAPTQLAIATAGGDFRLAVAADATLEGVDQELFGTISAANGLRAGGLGNHLVVEDSRGRRFLGYRFIRGKQVLLSTDGSRKAVLADGELVAEAVGAGPVSRFKLTGDQIQNAVFVDGRHALAVSTNRAWFLVDTVDGSLVDQGQLRATLSTLRFHPATGRLVGLAEKSQVVVAHVDVTARPALSRLVTLVEPAEQAWLIDPAADETVLVTVAGGVTVRRYRSDQLDLVAANPTPAETSPTPIAWIAADGTRFEASGARIAIAPQGPPPAPAGDLVPSRPAPRRPPPHPKPPPPPRQPPMPGMSGLRGFAGGVAVVADAAGIVRGLDADGAVRWTRNAGMGMLALDAAGDRVAVLTTEGAVVLDVATGEVIEQTCGWSFGAWPELPPNGSTMRPSACE